MGSAYRRGAPGGAGTAGRLRAAGAIAGRGGAAPPRRDAPTAPASRRMSSACGPLGSRPWQTAMRRPPRRLRGRPARRSARRGGRVRARGDGRRPGGDRARARRVDAGLPARRPRRRPRRRAPARRRRRHDRRARARRRVGAGGAGSALAPTPRVGGDRERRGGRAPRPGPHPGADAGGPRRRAGAGGRDHGPRRRSGPSALWARLAPARGGRRISIARPN